MRNDSLGMVPMHAIYDTPENAPAPTIMTLKAILMEQREMVVDLLAKLHCIDSDLLPTEMNRGENKNDESNLLYFAARTTEQLRECHAVINSIMQNLGVD